MPTQLNSSKKSFRFAYLFAFVPAITVLAGNLSGSWFTAGNMIFTLVLLVLVDFLLPDDRRRNSDAHGGFTSGLLILAVAVQLLCLWSLFYGIAAGRISGPWVWTAAISTGLNGGLLGLNTAHELIHRKQPILRWLGILNLFSCCYTHFYIEHRLGHHARVGTALDPATARMGESFYRFLLRTIPGQWISGFRLAGRKKDALPAGNFVLLGTLLSLLMLVLLFITEPVLAKAFLLSSAVAVFLLEYVNYIEHYGLVRRGGEKLAAEHAWQSDSLTSRFHLFELSRHSHHHLQSTIPYHSLESIEGPHRLPFGYFGMFYIALLPPLWFRVMDGRISKNHADTVSGAAG